MERALMSDTAVRAGTAGTPGRGNALTAVYLGTTECNAPGPRSGREWAVMKSAAIAARRVEAAFDRISTLGGSSGVWIPS